jgi:hypothetical protein
MIDDDATNVRLKSLVLAVSKRWKKEVASCICWRAHVNHVRDRNTLSKPALDVLGSIWRIDAVVSPHHLVLPALEILLATLHPILKQKKTKTMRGKQE